MITVAELKGMAENKSLPIGEAWNGLESAAERLEFIESFLTATAERMRLDAHVHARTDPLHAATMTAFAQDVMTGITAITKRKGG